MPRLTLQGRLSLTGEGAVWRGRVHHRLRRTDRGAGHASGVASIAMPTLLSGASAWTLFAGMIGREAWPSGEPNASMAWKSSSSRHRTLSAEYCEDEV